MRLYYTEALVLGGLCVLGVSMLPKGTLSLDANFTSAPEELGCIRTSAVL